MKAILDTETNLLDQVFDIGMIVFDEKTLISTFSFGIIIKENFETQLFYEEKRPLYEQRLRDVDYPLRFANGKQALEHLNKILLRGQIDEILAYNMPFDEPHMNSLYTQFDVKNEFAPIKKTCLWNWACQTILRQESYKNFTRQHNFFSPTGNMVTNAEVLFGFMSQNNKFVEEHTALSDCKIELEIYKTLLQYGQAKYICSAPWLLCQEKAQAKAMYEKVKKFDFEVSDWDKFALDMAFLFDGKLDTIQPKIPKFYKKGSGGYIPH